MKVITVQQANILIAKYARKAKTLFCPLASCSGKILAENICADRDQPSADRSAMDGIALNFKAWQNGCRSFRIQGVQKAGIAAQILRHPKNGCCGIMTGALIPHGCDTVIPIEQIKIFDHQALIQSPLTIYRNQWIRQQGSEYKKGDTLITSGHKINATHIGVFAAVGKKQVKVFEPRIAVIGTGDELVEINRQPKTYQSRRSNAYALEALLIKNGFTNVNRYHLNDHREQLLKGVKRILRTHEVLIFSGGVSMGKFDLIPQTLKALGGTILFHKVRQKPGKPLLFAQMRQGQAVFGLPGNPVSTLVCAVRYVLPCLSSMCVSHASVQMISLPVTIPKHLDFTLFYPVKKKAVWTLSPLTGSGDYGALADSDGVIEVPPGRGVLKKETKVKFFSW